MLLRETLAEIDLRALAGNIAQVRSCVGDGVEIMAVVKADAYGHGLVPVSKKAVRSGAGSLCVAICEEGIALREAGVTEPILVLGGSNKAAAMAAVEHGLAVTVFAPETVYAMQRAAEKTGMTAYAHLKADTGMNRIGVRFISEAQRVLLAIEDCKNVRLTGIYTHFSSADEPGGVTREQLTRFDTFLRHVRQKHPDILIHAANSAGALYHPASRFSGVRPGIAIYGSLPSLSFPAQFRLSPLMRWSAAIVQIKRLEPGDSVSYNRAFTADAPIMAATLPVGYGDGYARALSNKSHVLIKGKKARVLGRVCMDQMVVDVTGIDCRVGDEAVLLGRQGDNEITAWDMALWAGTIPYEVLLSVSPRVPRVYVDD